MIAQQSVTWLPLDEGDSVKQGKQDNINTWIVPDKVVELAKCLPILCPVRPDLCWQVGISLRRNGHSPGEDLVVLLLTDMAIFQDDWLLQGGTYYYLQQ